MSAVDRLKQSKKEKKRVAKSYKKRSKGIAEIKCEHCLREYDNEDDLIWDSDRNMMLCQACFQSFINSDTIRRLKNKNVVHLVDSVRV